MKKILNYLAGVAMMVFCVFGISACGSDDNNPTPNRPLQMYGEWVSAIQQSGVLMFESDVFNNGTVEATLYKIYGNNVMSGSTLVKANVTKIEKSGALGSFTYKDGILTVTYGSSQSSGSLKYGDDTNVVYWNINGNNLEMLRANDATNAFKSQVETLYKEQN